MGVFSKLKDVLFDVEEDEIPVITRDEKPVIEKEENPIKEVKMPKEDFLEDIEPISEEIEEIPKKSNFSFPMDDDFEDELPARSKRDYFDEEFTSRTRVKETRKAEPVKKRDEYEYDYSRLDIRDVRKEEPKSFKPSPVISPVYGILDQNYTKDDVIVKNDGIKRRATDKLTIDEVRNKAYGSKKKVKEEDEFEEPLRTLDEILIDKEEEKQEEIIEPKKEELIKDEPILDETSPIGVYDDELPDEPYADEEIEETEVDESKEDALESDLFNLIDSMYEERNESEEE